MTTNHPSEKWAPGVEVIDVTVRVGNNSLLTCTSVDRDTGENDEIQVLEVRRHCPVSNGDESPLHAVINCVDQGVEDTRKEFHHRELVGGRWDEIGRLQKEFLISSGLRPDHTLLDVGCGCLRGGIHYIEYLEEGNYYGLDINSSLIEAGRIEIDKAGLSNRRPNLIVDDKFSFEKFGLGLKFDFMISVSVFTHLPMNDIIRCLSKARESLHPDGMYFSTFFQAPTSSYLDAIEHQPGRITNYDSDPFHYSVEEIDFMAKLAKLEFTLVGDWGHPRNQKMAVFRLPKYRITGV